MAQAGRGVVFPSLEDIIELNLKHIERTGGMFTRPHNFNNDGSLRWVLEAIQDDRYYPTITVKAAVLAWTIITRHVFHDGNKRTAISAMMIFLRQNGFYLAATDSEILAVALSAAEASRQNYSRKQFLGWVENHIGILT